jgi:5-methylcytosine-specific restriction endonuclease McrA
MAKNRKGIEESDLLIPTLKIIKANPNCDMSLIIQKIPEYLCLTPYDTQLIRNRRDQRYSQIVRNQTSHFGSNDFSQCVTRIQKGNHYLFTINAHGLDLLKTDDSQKQQSDFQNVVYDSGVASTVGYQNFNDAINAGNRKPVKSQCGATGYDYVTDPKIGKTVIANAHYLCEYATLIGAKHPTFLVTNNTFYLEAHHLIPMKAQKDFPNQNLDRVENIVALCPTCHRAVHYGTPSEKRKILEPLYKQRISSLKNCKDQIFISFQDLFNKYYS